MSVADRVEHAGAVSVPPLGPIYDSAAAGSVIARQLREVWQLRGLMRILVTRDVILRYKRSLLGVWWTVLNPLLKMVVMWAVLSGVFHARAIGVPYIVYLLSGVIITTFFEQATLSAGGSLVNSSGVLSKVYAPPQLFAFSAVLAAAVTFVVSFAVLLVIVSATGVGVRATALLLPLPLAALVMLATGVGLLLAALAIRMYDVLDFTAVLLQLTFFVTPTFYPLSAVSSRFRIIIELNPLTQILILFRALLYEGRFPAWWVWAGSLGAGAAALVAGTVLMARSSRTATVML